MIRPGTDAKPPTEGNCKSTMRNGNEKWTMSRHKNKRSALKENNNWAIIESNTAILRRERAEIKIPTIWLTIHLAKSKQVYQWKNHSSSVDILSIFWTIYWRTQAHKSFSMPMHLRNFHFICSFTVISRIVSNWRTK